MAHPDETGDAEPVLEQWVIYHGMSDRVGPYTVRRWEIRRACLVATTDVQDALTLADARALVPRDAICLGRAEEDDAVICEVWT